MWIINKNLGPMDFSNTHIILLGFVVLSFCIQLPLRAADCFGSGNAVGISYRRVADNLPTPSKAVELMKSINVGCVKIYDDDSQVLVALANSRLPVVITISNDQIRGIASSSFTADEWVATNVVPYVPATNISMIMVGNKLLSDYGSKSLWPQLVPAMRNIHASLVLQPVLSILASTDSHFFFDVYPFIHWSSNRVHILLDYALFGRTTATSATRDVSLEYTNMLDAQLDATVAAMAKLGYGNVKLAIGETGWPSKGHANEAGATVASAALYNQRLVAKLLWNAGTPPRPNVSIPAFIFTLFNNEDDKAGGTRERKWGVFQADGTPVYAIDLSSGRNKSDNGE